MLSMRRGQEISVLCRNVVGFSIFIVPGFGSIAMEDTENDLRKLSESISLRRTGSVEANEKFLLRLKSRLYRVGIDIPKIEVRFEHLEVEAEAYVGSKALPSFLNFTTSIFEKHLTILHDVSGILKPNRMTLLLGPPSSGKTTLLLCLAGRPDKDLKVLGKVTYNGHEMNEFKPQRTATYISQHDVYIGELSVRETLSYSARFQGVGDCYAELSRREKEANIKPDPDLDLFMEARAGEGQEESIITDYMLKILGLEVCADTMVGDNMP
ncbi:hypothetical protein Droror1_Dr00000624 [Drosera rotundifolia]